MGKNFCRRALALRPDLRETELRRFQHHAPAVARPRRASSSAAAPSRQHKVSSGSHASPAAATAGAGSTSTGNRGLALAGYGTVRFHLGNGRNWLVRTGVGRRRQVQPTRCPASSCDIRPPHTYKQRERSSGKGSPWVSRVHHRGVGGRLGVPPSARRSSRRGGEVVEMHQARVVCVTQPRCRKDIFRHPGVAVGGRAGEA
jgi:hypothetical protein